MKVYLSKKMSPFVKGFAFAMASGFVVAGVIGISEVERSFTIKEWLMCAAIALLFLGMFFLVIRMVDKEVFFNLETITIVSRSFTREISLKDIHNIFLLSGYAWVTFKDNSGRKRTITLMSTSFFDLADERLLKLKSAVARARGIEFRNRALPEY